MMPIIKSMLDDDLYKFTMQNYALELFPDADVTYRFKNRGNHRFNQTFFLELQNQINLLSDIYLTIEEYKWIKNKLPFLTPGYVEYLRNFRYNPSDVSINLTEDNNLDIIIKGKWVNTILWEVKLLAIISELYFRIIDRKWSFDGQFSRAAEKIRLLSQNDCNFVDMGTRRRRSLTAQEIVLNQFIEYAKDNDNNSFLGTSNCYLAMKNNIKCFGSQAHEIYQAAQVLNSYNHCNYYALENWSKVFPNGDIGTALPDTVGIDAFLRDFNRKLSMLYFSIRHDSGCPFMFVDKFTQHFEKMRVNSQEKTAIFSDSLTVEKAIKIRQYCEGKIKCSFGIGTHFTNDFGVDSPALNMVIKLWSVNGCPTVKLGEGIGKENGDPKTVEFMRWILKNQTVK